LGAVRLRALTWNLMHGRSIPPSGRDLFGRFCATLGEFEWDVAMLQEVPPWWPAKLAAELSCEQRSVLTSRNALLPARRFVAVRWPDLIKSNGGGANAILARRDRIVEHRSARLSRLPERRVSHGVQLGLGIWVVNLHASAHDPPRAARDVATAVQQARGWAGSLPLLFGGDLNLREPELPGLHAIAGHDVDHIFIDENLAAVGPAEVLRRGTLSDHSPLAVSVEPSPAVGPS
jgi:endonuclease/exonuclease/phosphatase family metal-dependent hydrolase